MNKSILIVICDFLILSMLALARFDKAAPPDPNAHVTSAAPIAAAAQSDVVDSLRDSLRGEEQARAELVVNLEDRARALANEKSRAEALEQEKSRLQGEAERLERLSRELEQQRSALAGQYQMSQEERDRLRDEMVAAQARERLMQQQLESARSDLAQARGNIAVLQEARGRAERENAVLSTRLESASQNQQRMESEMGTLREEKNAVSRSAAELAHSVGTLAQVQEEQSAALRTEIRATTHLSLNEVFDLFRRSRAAVRSSVRVKTLIADADASFERYAVCAKDSGGRLLALCETGGTALRPAALGNVRSLSATLRFPGKSFEADKALFLASDPRVILFPVPDSLANDPAVRPFALEDNPLRFPTAVVVTANGEKYGEAPIRVIPGTNRYVDVETSLANVLFGSFSPDEGDLVFSLNGRLIGFMVSSGRAIVLKDLATDGELPLGAAYDASRASFLSTRFSLSAEGAGLK